MTHNISTLIHDVKSITIKRYAVQRREAQKDQHKEFFVTAIGLTLENGDTFEIRAFESEKEPMTFMTSPGDLPITWDE